MVPHDEPPVVMVGLLGPMIVVSGAAEPVPINGRVQRKILALLAVDPGAVVSVDVLANQIWHENPPSTAAAALRVHIARIRSVLTVPATGGSLLLHRPPGYQLDRSICTDIGLFEQDVRQAQLDVARGEYRAAAKTLEAALRLWRGPALEGLDDVEPLAQMARQWEQVRLEAQEQFLGARMAIGEHAQITGLLQQQVDEAPLRENRTATLMLALYRTGRQADALAACRRLRERLAAELGVEPSPAVQQMEGAILRQEPHLTWTPGTPQPGSLSAESDDGPGGSTRSRRGDARGRSAPFPGPAAKEVPAALADLIVAQVALLSAESLTVLRALAVLGGQSDHDPLAATAGCSPAELADALTPIRSVGGLLRRHPGEPGVAFAHRATADIVLAGCGLEQQRRLHFAAARALRVTPAHHEAAVLHLLDAVPEFPAERAARIALLAADRALIADRVDEAADVCRRALGVVEEYRLPPEIRVDLLVLLVRAAGRLGDVTGGQAVWGEAVQLARQLRDAERFAIAVLSREWGRRTIVADSGDRDLLLEALELLGPTPTALRVRVASTLLGEISVPGRLSDIPQLLAEVDAGARAVGDDAGLLAALQAQHVLSRPRPLSSWTPGPAAELSAVARRHQAPYWLAVSGLIDLYDATRRGRGAEIDAARASLADSVGVLQSARLSWHRGLSEAAVHQLRGDFGAADEWAERAAIEGATAGIRDAAAAAIVHRYLGDYQTGSVVPLLPLLESYVEAQPSVILTRAAMALALAEANRPLDAAAAADAFLDIVAATPFDETAITCVALAAQAATRIPYEPLRCRRFRTLLTPFTGEFIVLGQVSGTFGPVDRLLALLSADGGDTDLALELLTGAARLSESIGSPTWQARCAVDKIGVLRRADRSVEAAELALQWRPRVSELGLACGRVLAEG